MTTEVWVRRPQGLANKFDPARINYSREEGISHYAEAVNVNFDITLAASRRLGYEETDIALDCHSLFDAVNFMVLVAGTDLCLLGEDETLQVIRTGLTAGKVMSYAQVGDSVLYMNGSEKGVIKAGASWDYELPSSHRYPDSTRVYSDPPIGSIIRYFSSRVYIASGNALWFSEPFGPNVFRKSMGYLSFPGRITMIAPVRDGIFLSTVRKVYFLSGRNPKEFVQTVVSSSPAIEGTDVEADGIAILAGKLSPTPVQMFTTTAGICVGLPDGQVQNLTHDVLEYPKCNRGSAVFTGSKYIVSLEA